MNNFDGLKKFLKSPVNEQYAKEGYNILFKIFSSRAIIFKIHSHEKIINLYHEFLLNKIFNNLTFRNFLDRAKDNEIKNYLYKMIDNFLKNEFKKNKNFDVIFDENEIKKDNSLFPEINFEAKLLISLIGNNLTLREKMILCKFLFKERYNFLKNLSKDAYYKAVERLKKKLQEIILKNKISKESVDLFFEKIFMSEICEKICLNSKENPHE